MKCSFFAAMLLAWIAPLLAQSPKAKNVDLYIGYRCRRRL